MEDYMKDNLLRAGLDPIRDLQQRVTRLEKILLGVGGEDVNISMLFSNLYLTAGTGNPDNLPGGIEAAIRKIAREEQSRGDEGKKGPDQD